MRESGEDEDYRVYVVSTSLLSLSWYLVTFLLYRGRVVELATNCYGTHVVQKALECEEDIKRIIVAELLANDPAYTLTSKHCRHVLVLETRSVC